MIQPGANVTRADRYKYKAALVTALAQSGGDFHVVAQLPVGRSRAALEDALYAWVARVDRHYLGRSWSAPHRRPERMRGVVFFETSGGNDHAHLVVTAPATAAPLHFLLHARYLFQVHPVQSLRAVYGRSVTRRGSMRVWRIGETGDDRERVLNYVAKGLEVSLDRCEWKFLDQLAPMQAGG